MDVAGFIGRAARDEDGAILPFVAIASPLFILMLAFTVDMDIGRLTANKLQISADAAALAAVHELPSSARVEATAIEYARKNYSTDNANTRDITSGPNIEMGYWDAGTRQFYPGDEIAGFFGQRWDEANDIFVPATVPNNAQINAVWVRVRRDETNDNPLPSAFASFVGIEGFDIKKTSIAVANPLPGTECLAGGMLSDDYVQIDDDSRFDDFCVYGRRYVELDDENDVNDGTLLVMENEANYRPSISEDTNNYVDRDEQIQSNTDAEWDVGLPAAVDTVVALMQDGSMPSGIAEQFGVVGFEPRTGSVTSNNQNQFVTRRLYFVDGDVTLRGWHQDTFIVASGRITIDDNAVLLSSFLVAENDIRTGENVWVGRSLPCFSGDPVPFDVYLWAGDDFRGSSNGRYFATQVVAKDEVTMEDDNTAFGWFSESTDAAIIDDDNSFRNCGGGLFTNIGSLPRPFQGPMRVSLRN